MAEVSVPQMPVEDVAEEVPTKRTYFFQLDVLKAIAIAFVVMDHSLTWEVKGSIGSIFWERLSIPFFLIVMGFNMGYSFRYRGAESLRELYTRDYFIRKIVRYVFPFLVLYMGSILLGLYFNQLQWDEYILLGYLPFWGPGNWFIALLFGSIVVFPLVYWAFNKMPKVTLALCFLSELVLQGIMYVFYPYPAQNWTALEAFIVTAIRLNIFFFLPAVGLGLWFSRGHEMGQVRNYFIYLYFPISLVFMVDYQTGILSSIPGFVGQFFTSVNDFIRGDYTLLFYGYAALLFLIAMRYIPKTAHGRSQRLVRDIGRASYHILLFEIFYMSIVYWFTSQDAAIHKYIPDFAAIYGWTSGVFYIPFYIMNLSFCFGGGLLWYYAEKRANKEDRPWWKHTWMQRTAYLFMALFSLVLMGASIEFISDITGLTAWGRTHTVFILNYVTGPGIMACVCAIIFFIGLSMLFLYRSFTIAEEIPI
ncbi:MAG: acyltransferase family protein [Promethearchaeota archaeon]